MENEMTEELTHQQKRFCDEYLLSFNAYRAALSAGYSENTARKAELLHVPKIQTYLKAAMNQTASRLQITHDMILRELAKVAFANMGDYYDYRGELKPMCELSEHEKAAISQYQILHAVNDEGYRVGEMAKIKLHNKMSALDKIARHLNFYGVASQKQESRGRKQEEEVVGCELPVVGLEEEEIDGFGLPFVDLEEGEEVGSSEPGVQSGEDGVFDDALGVANDDLEAALADELGVVNGAVEVAFTDGAVMQNNINESGPSLEGPDLVLEKILTLSPLEGRVGRGESGVKSLLLHALGM